MIIAMKYEITYDSLVYGIAIDQTYQGHIFRIREVPSAQQEYQPSDFLYLNARFFSCCFADDQKKTSFCTMQPEHPIILLSDKDEKGLEEDISNSVNSDLIEMEHRLMTVLNIQVLFVQTSINVLSEDSSFCKEMMSSRPHLPLSLLKNDRYVDIQSRFALGLNWEKFQDFLGNKRHCRYRRAYDLFIKSFYESSCTSSYFLLCASVEAITGNSKSKLKERFAKYASVLACRPYDANEENKWREIYSLRSNVIHGKEVEITAQQEWEFRERVHAFIIGYYLFWINLNPSNEIQFLQMLDQFYDHPSDYAKKAPAAYSFMQVLSINSKVQGGIFSLPFEARALTLISSLLYAALKK